MLVNVNGQVCELIKAEPKGGSYHRRVPRKKGKGYTYYYDEEKYNASKNAHLDGPATREARLAKAVLGAVDGAGKNGCAVKSLRKMAKKEGKEHVAAAIKKCLEKGELSIKKGTLYRKAKKAEQEEQPLKAARKAKSMREAPESKKVEKSGPGLYLDELRKAKGPIGVGKRGGKIYGYDKKGKPIYAPTEAPSKPAKKKLKKPRRYFQGDKAEYTGKTKMLHGALAHEYVYLEGHLKGESKWTYNAPRDEDYFEEIPVTPSKPAKKKKPAKPSPQLSLFGQTTLEKPKPQPKPKKAKQGWRADLEAASGPQPEPKETPVGALRVRTVRSGFNTGKAPLYAVEVHDPQPGKMPWRTLKGEGAIRSYEEAVERRKQLEAGDQPKPEPKKASIKAKAKQKVVSMPFHVISVFETDIHELAADPEGHGLSATEARAYKMLDQAHDRNTDKFKMPKTKAEAQAMGEVLTEISNTYDDRAEAGVDKAINRRIASALATLSGKINSYAETLEEPAEGAAIPPPPEQEAKAVEHVEETPLETPATIQVEQEKHEPTEWAKRVQAEHREKALEESHIKGLRHRIKQGGPDAEKAQEELIEFERTRKPPREFTPEMEAQNRATWEGIPRSGPGWKLITKPYAKQKLKRWVDDTVAKIDKLPPGSMVRVTEIDGKTVDWRVLGGGQVTLTELKKDTPMPTYVALPVVGGAVFAQVEVKPAKVESPEPGKEAKVEPAAEHDTAEQHAAVTLPELPPKPEHPGRIARKDFGREMRRRFSEGLYSSKNTYSVKEEIKEVGGVWDRYNNTWLLPSQEALDYVEALLPHKEAEQVDETNKAISEGRTVSGRTWDVRTQIKNAGGRWHGPTKQWIMPDKESAEMMQQLVERTTTGSYGSVGGKPTARQIDVASAMLQKVGNEAWKRSPYAHLSIARVRAMLPEMSMLEVSDLISMMKGDKAPEDVVSSSTTQPTKPKEEKPKRMASEKQINYAIKLMNRYTDPNDFNDAVGMYRKPSREAMQKWDSEMISSFIEELKGGY